MTGDDIGGAGWAVLQERGGGGTHHVNEKGLKHELHGAVAAVI